MLADLRPVAATASVTITQLPASTLSRAANGSTLPRWETVAAYAQACGADPATIRPSWEKARARHPKRRTAPTHRPVLPEPGHHRQRPDQRAAAPAGQGWPADPAEDRADHRRQRGTTAAEHDIRPAPGETPRSQPPDRPGIRTGLRPRPGDEHQHRRHPGCPRRQTTPIGPVRARPRPRHRNTRRATPDGFGLAPRPSPGRPELAPKLHVSNQVPGPQVLGSLRDETDRTDGDIPPGQFPAKSLNHRSRRANHVAIGHRDMRYPRLVIQPPIPSGGKPRGILYHPQHRVQSLMRSRIQHDRPRVVQDPSQRDPYRRRAGEKPPRMIRHRVHLIGRDLVREPGDEGGHVQPFPWYQVQSAQPGKPSLGDTDQLHDLQMITEEHEPHELRPGRIRAALRRPVIFHLDRKRAHRSSRPSAAAGAAGHAAAVNTRICSRSSPAFLSPANRRCTSSESISARYPIMVAMRNGGSSVVPRSGNHAITRLHD